MDLKEELELNVSDFKKIRISKMENMLKLKSEEGYSECEFHVRFYGEDVIEYFKNKGLKYEIFNNSCIIPKMTHFKLKW